MESKARSIVKAVIWTLMGLLMMCGVGFAMTGSLELGGQMAVLNSGLGLICYVIYERIWSRIRWGRDAG